MKVLAGLLALFLSACGPSDSFKAEAYRAGWEVSKNERCRSIEPPLDSLTRLNLRRLSQVSCAAMWACSHHELTAASAAWNCRRAWGDPAGAAGTAGAIAG